MDTSKTMGDRIQEVMRTGEKITVYTTGHFLYTGQVMENGCDVIAVKGERYEYIIRKDVIISIASERT